MNNSTIMRQLSWKNGVNIFTGSNNSIRKGFDAGFTLIELCIVIAIIGTLAAIALPNYIRYKFEAMTQVAITDIRMIEKQIALFVLDNNGQLPNSLSDLPNIGNVNDPWGNPYRYLDTNGGKAPGIRKNMSDNPVNQDYDLYSMGKDGLTSPSFKSKKSRDDVVRAYEGRYVGLVSEL